MNLLFGRSPQSIQLPDAFPGQDQDPSNETIVGDSCCHRFHSVQKASHRVFAQLGVADAVTQKRPSATRLPLCFVCDDQAKESTLDFVSVHENFQS